MVLSPSTSCNPVAYGYVYRDGVRPEGANVPKL